MKRNKFFVIFIFSITLFMISFGLGYQLMGSKLKSDNLADMNKQTPVEEDIQIIKEENRITPNTFIEERIHYKECGDLDTELNLADDEIINMTRKEYESYLKSNYPNERLVSYSSTKIVLWSERNYLCQKHFIVGEENGYIAIFKINENGEQVLYKTFEDYPLSILIKADQNEIKNGIRVDSEDELSDVLENYIS